MTARGTITDLLAAARGLLDRRERSPVTSLKVESGGPAFLAEHGIEPAYGHPGDQAASTEPIKASLMEPGNVGL